MPKFIVDIWLDGVEEEEQEAECEQFLDEQLNSSGTSVTITKIEEYEDSIEEKE